MIDVNVNFYELRPLFKNLPPYSLLYENDQSTNRKNSSEVMWYIFLMRDEESEFKHMDIRDRNENIKLVLNRDVFKDTPNIEDYLNKYDELFKSPERRLLEQVEQKIHQKANFLKYINYNEETYEMIEKIIKGTNDTIDMYEKLKAKIEKSKDDVGKGGSKQSLSDSGLI